ncbi:MAG: hypothetical protein OHK0029_13460 [Armatimonadaceae bacterium]
MTQIPARLSRRHLMTGIGLALLAPDASFARSASAPSPLPVRSPEELGLTRDPLTQASLEIQFAVTHQGVPGADFLVAHQGAVALRQTVGHAGIAPEPRLLAPQTLFDLASLTKVIATTTAIAVLVEQGKVGLDTPVAVYLRPFAEAGGERAQVTVRHLLTHTAGIPAGGNYRNKTVSVAEMVRDIAASRRMGAPGEKFIYSDHSAVALQAIVEAVSGKKLDVFCREQIFAPLGMTRTLFRPTGAQAALCAATMPEDKPEMRGTVHDPTARALGGVSGNAGLFSTAEDLAVFCQMMLNGGEYGGVRILKPETVRLFTEGQSLTDGKRGLGWDRDSGYSIRGGFPVGSYGHTGFTGTSLWIDPQSKTLVILLTNAVHNPRSGGVLSLRRTVSSLVASAVPAVRATMTVPAQPSRVYTGLEVLSAENYRRLAGRKVGVVCNHTALNREGKHLVDQLAQSGKVQMVALFGPEHSIRGDVDASATDSRDAKTGLPVYSLYNLQLPREQRYRPTPEQLQGVDTLIYDIQDIGARYYTYIATLGYCMEAAAKQSIRVVLLDRPNPLGGELMEGPLLDPERAGAFTAYHTTPITHGMTVGELAQMFNTEKKIGAELDIVPVAGWKRTMRYDGTGLPWVNPSPNMRSQRAAWLYPGVGLLEVLPLSVGRGTDTPFEIFGAPFIDPVQLADALNRRNLPGVSFVPVRFTPVSSVHKDKECGGVHVNLWDRNTCLPSELGMHLIDVLLRSYPKDLPPNTLTRLSGMIGAQRTVDDLIAGKPVKDIVASWTDDLAAFRRRRTPFLIYS